jgi:hypothetical protein
VTEEKLRTFDVAMEAMRLDLSQMILGAREKHSSPR